MTSGVASQSAVQRMRARNGEIECETERFNLGFRERERDKKEKLGILACLIF